MLNQDKIQKIVSDLLLELGQDASREGLVDTPKRVAKAYLETLEGYGRSFEDEITVFANEGNYDDIIYSGDINFFSTCEHHLLPFYGKAHIAYIPGEKIIGLSKLARAVDIYARRLQNQERITTQVADELMTLLNAKGVAVLLDGKHFCNMARGVGQIDSTMKTIIYRGDFKGDPLLQTRFMSMVG